MAEQITHLLTQRERLNSASLLQTQNGQTASISVFRNEPPATPEYLKQWGATMQAAFPQVKPEFWAMVGKIIRKDGISQARLAYIAETLCREWKYPTMQIADILNIDRAVKIWGYREFVRQFYTDRVEGYCILKVKGRDGLIQFANTQEAKLAGLEILREF